MADNIQTELNDGILIIRLNRPQHHNAWTIAMRDHACDVLDQAVMRSDVRALVFTGTGDKAFCAGQDLAETAEFEGGEHTRNWLDRLKRFYDAVRSMPKPVVGALNGLAAGSGFQITLLMDVIVAHRGVQMGQPEINSGIPSILGPWLMKESLGRSRVVELAVTGRMMGAEESHRLGLIHHLVSPEKVLETALEVAKDLAAKPPHAMGFTKEYLRRSNDAEYERAWKWAEEGQVAAFETGEPQEVMRKFFEVRRHRKVGKG